MKITTVIPLLFLLFAKNSALANNYTVELTADIDGRTDTLRGAIEAANDAGGEDTHTITISVSPLPATFNLPNGPLSIESNILLIGQGQSQTLIDGRNLAHTTQNQCFVVYQNKNLSTRRATRTSSAAVIIETVPK